MFCSDQSNNDQQHVRRGWGGTHGSPAPTPTPMPSPQPQNLYGVRATPTPGYWNYIVKTSSNSYYFPSGSKLSRSSDGTMLLARGYFETFNWNLGDVIQVLNYGSAVSPSTLPQDSTTGGVTLQSISPSGGCDASQQTCAPCPDCVGPPGNPQGCQYGTDPIAGGCISDPGGVWICIDPTGALYRCTSGDFGAIDFGGSNFNVFHIGPFVRGTTKDYTWFSADEVTTSYNVGPDNGVSYTAVYEDITGDIQFIYPTLVDPTRPVNGNFDNTVTWVSRTKSQFDNAIGAQVGSGVGFLARQR